MPYRLGIDLGTTFTAAAICRESPDRTVHTELVQLGTRSSSVPSVLFMADDMTLVGEVAERRALTDPESVVREFKRRVGDEIPIVVGETPHEAHELLACLVRWVIDRVIEREGEPPDAIAVTHPASWGPHRAELLRSVLDEDVVLLTEPQAAAMQYASAERVDPGTTIAVYDLGGGTFDAAVVHKTKSGDFELLGTPEGLDRLGGVDFDDAIVEHVLASVPDSGLTDSVAMARLRRECTEAKEALSVDTEAAIPVLLPGIGTQVRLARSQFEGLIEPVLADTVQALGRAIASAGLCNADVDSVLLVGGSSRIPLAGRLISAKLGRPVAVDADPKGVVAMGAALAAHRSLLSDEDRLIPSPRRPDHDLDPPELKRPRTRLRRTKLVLGTFAMLALALAVIPSPFTSDTETTTKDGTAPAHAGQPGTQAGKPTQQPGTTKKRNPQDRPGGAADSDDPESAPDAKQPGATGNPGAEARGDAVSGAGPSSDAPASDQPASAENQLPSQGEPPPPGSEPPASVPPPASDPPTGDPPASDPPPPAEEMPPTQENPPPPASSADPPSDTPPPSSP
ncbi:Hsp70 family protein [Kibdelosporangium philippinense]|uniref:Hsp70 family protein n=1 Tax=Kibdelosporangium philippinense TaxID=211113 RepID=A0ABS8ZBC8_9PSEU|nr:Hsp70 family protein [Kibdelosporangium philippinense]MCE7003843.1 Hsp70 family protein [Kibdelosporangium philippinense]